MFKKILYPTDFSKSSEKVIPYLKELKDAGTKEIVVLHVLDDRYHEWKDSLVGLTESARRELVSDYADSMNKKARKNFEKIEKELSQFFKVKVVMESGRPFKTILDVANREDVSCIALCSHGVSDLQEMLLGSVSEKVIRKSKQPCLVVKR